MTFTHCFSLSLNRAAANSLNHKNLPEARQFFSLLELRVVFIKAGNRIKFFLSRQTELIEEEKVEVSTENQAKELDESDHCLDAASSSSLTIDPLADETAPSLSSQES